MTRIHTLLVDKGDHEPDLLTAQLERVAPAESPLTLALKCTPVCFGEQCAIANDVFQQQVTQNC